MPSITTIAGLSTCSIMLSGCFALPVQNYKISETNDAIRCTNLNQELTFRATCGVSANIESNVQLHAIDLLRNSSKDERYAIFLTLYNNDKAINKYYNAFMKSLFKEELNEFIARYNNI